MRIVHAVTLVSDSGAYGGPVSVATGQLRALRARGHEVRLLALWQGSGPPPTVVDEVPLTSSRARTFVPRMGMLGLLNLRYPKQLWTAIGAADVVHVHTGRDLASLAAVAIAKIRHKRYFVQTHGMVSVRKSIAAKIFDLALRPLLKSAEGCFVLTAEEREQMTKVLGVAHPKLVDLGNGVEERVLTKVDESTPAVVLFLARLHERKRPLAFVEAAAIVVEALPAARFELYGPDEGELPAVLAAIDALGIGGSVAYKGAVEHEEAIRITSRAAVYVLPSVNEPFPMSLLEALAVDTPAVCTGSTGISQSLQEYGAAVVTDGSPAELASGIIRILRDAEFRQSLSVGSGRAISELYSIGSVAAKLENLYLISPDNSDALEKSE